MKIGIKIKGKPAGYIEYEVINEPGLMGTLGPINVVPRQLGAAIERRIKQNEDIVVSGGTLQRDLSEYFDGVVLVLERLMDEIDGFTYEIPDEENPYLQETPEDFDRRVH